MMDAFVISQIVQQAVEAGVANYMRHAQPSSDALKKREAYRWLKTMGLRPSVLDEMIGSGRVSQTRMGAGKNSPLVVSKSEIITAITAAKISTLIK